MRDEGAFADGRANETYRDALLPFAARIGA